MASTHDRSTLGMHTASGRECTVRMMNGLGPPAIDSPAHGSLGGWMGGYSILGGINCNHALSRAARPDSTIVHYTRDNEGRHSNLHESKELFIIHLLACTELNMYLHLIKSKIARTGRYIWRVNRRISKGK